MSCFWLRTKNSTCDSLTKYWWAAGIILLVLSGMALAGFVQNATTRILDALAEEVLQQQNDVANLLHEYAAVMLVLEQHQNKAHAYGAAPARKTVEAALEKVQQQLQEMRSNYSFERLDGAAKAHAYVTPILGDVQQWLTGGLPGYGAFDPVTILVAEQRMHDRYGHLRDIATETDAVARSLIAEQSGYLQQFRGSLISLLALFAMLALGIVALLVRQTNLQTRLRLGQEKHAQRLADFADIGADWFWEMTPNMKLKVLSGQSWMADNGFHLDVDSVADGYWPVDHLNAREEFSEFESDWLTAGGEKRVIEMNGKPLFGVDGEFAGYRGIGRDVTRRRNIEIELEAVYKKLIEAQTRGREQAEKALRDSEQFLRISLDAMSANIAILDGGGYIRVVNKAWKSIATGALPEGGLSHHYCIALSARPAEELSGLAAARRSIEDVLTGARSSLQYEFPCRMQDEMRWMLIQLTTFMSNAQRYAVLVYEDITERRKLEEEDRRLRADLAHVARLTTAGETATVLAHELNQPLTAISHNSDALLANLREIPDTAPEIIETVTDIYEQAHRAGGIIQSMRRMVRKDTKATTQVDINQLVVETVRLTHPEAREHNVSVQLHLSENLPKLLIDPVQIQQVLVNLERNGVEAICYHGATVRELYISTELDDDQFIRIAVQDTGPGVTADIRRNLFKSFHTSKTGGMGMGLSISRSIVEAHGGRLWLEQPKGGLTTFYFTLPVTLD